MLDADTSRLGSGEFKCNITHRVPVWVRLSVRGGGEGGGGRRGE